MGGKKEEKNKQIQAINYPAKTLNALSDSGEVVVLSIIASGLALDADDLSDHVSGGLEELLEISIRGLLALGSLDEHSTLGIDSLLNQSNLQIGNEIPKPILGQMFGYLLGKGSAKLLRQSNQRLDVLSNEHVVVSNRSRGSTAGTSVVMRSSGSRSGRSTCMRINTKSKFKNSYFITTVTELLLHILKARSDLLKTRHESLDGGFKRHLKYENPGSEKFAYTSILFCSPPSKALRKRDKGVVVLRRSTTRRPADQSESERFIEPSVTFSN